MRIVAGSAKGRALQGPKPTSRHIRPTADRVRETLFNVLGQWLEGQAVLDLYAGTGALALEVFGHNPIHTGAAHYVIHSFDDPVHAILALAAAKRYAEIAPRVRCARIFSGLSSGP